MRGRVDGTRQKSAPVGGQGSQADSRRSVPGSGTAPSARLRRSREGVVKSIARPAPHSRRRLQTGLHAASPSLVVLCLWFRINGVGGSLRCCKFRSFPAMTLSLERYSPGPRSPRRRRRPALAASGAARCGWPGRRQCGALGWPRRQEQRRTTVANVAKGNKASWQERLAAGNNSVLHNSEL